MNEVLDVLKRWKLELSAVRQRMYRAPTPRERERWHAVWLLAKGWSAAQVATHWSATRTRLGSGWPPFGRRGRPD